MNKNNITTGIVTILLVCAVGYIIWQNKVAKTVELVSPIAVVTPSETQPTKSIQITTPLNTPLSGDAVIAGVARMVYFEASFPVKLVDGNNAVAWQGPATAQSDWMVTTDVPFIVTIPTLTIPNGNYTLVLTQDDPSGELVPPALYSISVPVVIQN